MGDCNILCAASGLPIEPDSPAVGIVCSKNKVDVDGHYQHNPTAEWQFLAGPLRIETTGDYTPQTDLRREIYQGNPNIMDSLAHLHPHLENPLAGNSEYIGNHLLIPRLRDTEKLPLTVIWFRQDIWEKLAEMGKQDPSPWITRVKDVVEYCVGDTDTIPDHVTHLSETNRNRLALQDRSLSTCDICHILLALTMSKDRDTVPESLMRGFLDFLPVLDSLHEIHIILRPNTYCNQGHWMEFDKNLELRATENKIIRENTEEEN